MHLLKVMLAFLLLASCGVSLASAAGTGTFSIQQTTSSVGVGQFGVATLVMDNTWTLPADSVTLTLKWDPAIVQYVSTDWKVGHSVDATPSGTDTLVMNFADLTNKYPSGRVLLADINFKALQAGQSTMSITVSSVRSHAGISETEFTDLTATAITNPGTFTVGQGGAVTTVPTVPVVTTLTVIPTLTTGPTTTGNVTGGITTPITIPTTVPTTGITTGITTGAPFVPTQASSGGSEDYTGVVTRTATVTPTTTASVTTTATATVTATSGTGNGTVTTATATPGANNTTRAATVTATQTAFTTTPAGTTTARTTVPVNTTATRSGADVLPLAVAGLAALALIAARRR